MKSLLNSLIGKGSFAIMGSCVVLLTGCESITGTLSTNGSLTLKDTNGAIHSLTNGELNITLKNKTVVFKTANDKFKISNAAGFSLPSPGEQRLVTAASSGQNVDVLASASTVDRGSSTSTSREQCDCDPSGCYGIRDIQTTTTSETTAYEIQFLVPNSATSVAEFRASTTSGGSSSIPGVCINVRPRPLCPPGTVFDRSIGRCVSIVTPPRPFPEPRPLPPGPRPFPPGPRPIPNPAPAGSCPPGTHQDRILQRCVAN